MLRGVVLLAAAAMLASPFLPQSAANTVMTDSGNPIVFTSQGGNEWWVQVAISGQGSGTVAGMDAMDTGGPWTAMAKHYDWGYGVWAASFHVEPGHQVRFRASWPGGAQQVSCWFTHPQGVEQCPTGPAWNAQRIGGNGITHIDHTDVAVGDVRGKREVFVAGTSGVTVSTWTSNGWATSPIYAGNADHVALGDIRRNGGKALYVSTHDEASNTAAIDMVWWDG